MSTRLKVLLAGFAVGFLAIQPVMAGDDAFEFKSRKVFHGDLDLTSQAGRDTLDRRIYSAARAVCGPADWREVHQGRCLRQTIADAQPRVQAAVMAANARQTIQLATR
jgi:UrcA family protein